MELILEMKRFMLVLILGLVQVSCRCKEGQIWERYGSCIDCEYTYCNGCNGVGCIDCFDGFRAELSGCISCAGFDEIFVDGRCKTCQELGGIFRENGLCECEVDEDKKRVDPGCCNQDGVSIFGEWESVGYCGSCLRYMEGCKKCDGDNCIQCMDGFERVERWNENFYCRVEGWRGDERTGNENENERWNPNYGRQLGTLLTLLTILLTLT